ncbi:TPA: hypothetical protein DCX15_00370 [bacterium]|nr:hypothetical protein [bacterium]
MSCPIFDGQLTKNRIEKTESDLQAAKYALRKKEREI